MSWSIPIFWIGFNLDSIYLSSVWLKGWFQPSFFLVGEICRDGMDANFTPLTTVARGPYMSSSFIFYFFFKPVSFLMLSRGALPADRRLAPRRSSTSPHAAPPLLPHAATVPHCSSAGLALLPCAAPPWASSHTAPPHARSPTALAEPSRSHASRALRRPSGQAEHRGPPRAAPLHASGPVASPRRLRLGTPQPRRSSPLQLRRRHPCLRDGARLRLPCAARP
jgi:hypothetical protein